MLRSRLVLATFVLLTLGATAGAQAADVGGLLFAQSAAIADLRGSGFYLNLLKFIPVVAIYLLWSWTSYWVDDDCRELNNLKFEMWNSAVFVSGVLGCPWSWRSPSSSSASRSSCSPTSCRSSPMSM